MELNIYKTIPESLLTCQVEDLDAEFKGPFLLEIGPQNQAPLFVSTLLHGNETSGFLALQKILLKYSQHAERMHRPLLALVGNTKAAAQGQRALEGQPDYNRIWIPGVSPEHSWAQKLLEYVRQKKIFAGVDIHNNTGRNPFYSCMTSLEEKALSMASLFSPHIVYFQKPEGVLSKALSAFSTSITIECGLPGAAEGVAAVHDFLLTLLHLDALKSIPLHNSGINVYHSQSRLLVPGELSLALEESPDSSLADFVIPRNFDGQNFCEVSPQTSLLRRNNPKAFLILENSDGEAIQDEMLVWKDNELFLRKTSIPSMFTRDIFVARQDCLGYLMDRIT